MAFFDDLDIFEHYKPMMGTVILSVKEKYDFLFNIELIY